jgi:hypothetical protein
VTSVAIVITRPSSGSAVRVGLAADDARVARVATGERAPREGVRGAHVVEDLLR